MYRRPDHSPNEDTDLYNLMQETLTSDETIIVGDFNLPKINWNLGTSDALGAKRLLDFMDENYLEQMVKEPTRQNNILDLSLRIIQCHMSIEFMMIFAILYCA